MDGSNILCASYCVHLPTGPVGDAEGDDVRGRIAGWQIRLAEYDLELRNVKVAKLELATGLSRMLDEIMDPPALIPQ